MRVQFEDQDLVTICLGRYDDAICAVKEAKQPPAGATMEKLAFARDPIEASTAVFDRFKDECEYGAAIGRAGAPAPRLRSEHRDDPELDPDKWTPFDPDVDKGLGLNKAAGSIHDVGVPNTVKKLKDGTVLVFNAQGKVRAAYAPGHAPEEVLAIAME